MAVEIRGLRIRTLWIILALIFVAVFILALVFVITVLIIKTSWWWTLGTFIIEVVIGAIAVVIYVVVRLQRTTLPVIRQAPEEAKERVIHELTYDVNNPDNFKIVKQKIINVGDPAKPKTQLAHFNGEGTELGMKIDVIVNLMNPKFEMSRLDGATEGEVQETIRLMAENPETEITQKTTTGWDVMGKPVTTTETKAVSSHAEKEQQEAQKEADLSNAF